MFYVSWLVRPGGIAAHEFGHTLQFIGLSGIGGWAGKGPSDVMGAYLALGAIGTIPKVGAWWESLATGLGGAF